MSDDNHTMTDDLRKSRENTGQAVTSAVKGATSIAHHAVRGIGEFIDTGVVRGSEIATATVGATKIVTAAIDQGGNVSEAAINAVGEISTEGLKETGEIGKVGIKSASKISQAALTQTGDIGTTVVTKTGEGTNELLGHVITGAFRVSNDLLAASNELWSSFSSWIKTENLNSIFNQQKKVIEGTIRDIDKMLNVNTWVNDLMKSGEAEGWIPKSCFFWGCKGRKAIRIVINAIVQSILFEGKNLQNLSTIKLNFKSYEERVKSMRMENKLVREKGDHADEKNKIISSIETLNPEIEQSFKNFNKILDAMRNLANPEIFKLRSALATQERNNQFKKMSPQEQELFTNAIKVTNQTIQPVENNPDTNINKEMSPEEIVNHASAELKTEIQEVNNIPTEKVGAEQNQFTNSHLGNNNTINPASGGKIIKKNKNKKGKKRNKTNK